MKQTYLSDLNESVKDDLITDRISQRPSTGPTKAEPGTVEKIAVMYWRHQNGLPIQHEDDAKEKPR